MSELWSALKALQHGVDRVNPRARRAAGEVCAVAVAVAVVFAGVNADSAQAFPEINPFYLLPLTASPSMTQAGGHPDIHVKFTVENHDEAAAYGHPEPCNCGDANNVITRLPAGVIGDPNNVPRCTQVNFDNAESCSPDTQVGVAIPGILFGAADREFNEPGHVFELHTPLYNLEPHPGQAGLLGFFLPLVHTPAYIVLSARTGSDYGLNAEFLGVEHLIPADGFTLELWGVPAEARHDSQRCTSLTGGFFGVGECATTGPSNAELKPFLDNPTVCGGPLETSLEVLYYSHKVVNETAPWPATTGCDQLTFNPSLYAQPTTTATDAPSGLDVDLTVPQLQSPVAPSPSEIRAITVTLPEGMAINPNAADGKTSCTDAEARFGSDEEAQCPETAKVGTLSLTSTALPGPIPGAIYLGAPEPGNRYRLILTANGFATHVKLRGSVEPDPRTGQLVVAFRNLPQSPFSDFNLHFFGSERGLLATPARCGTYPVTSTFTPWDSVLPTQTSTQYFTLKNGPNGSGCPISATRPFNPGFQSGVVDATAGARSPFFFDLTRSDGDQNLSALNVTTPPGLLGSLAGIPYCPDVALTTAAESSHSGLAEVANPSCPTTSQIGTSETGAGAGTHPLYLPGRVYLAGPYRGAPLSLAVITPAASGPYDLGNVVVRAALHINPETAQITAYSDPLPQILQGIPLRLRSILIKLDRQNFILNPTNCNSLAVNGQAMGDEGALASLTNHFEVASCTDLGFAPKLAMKLSGSTKRAGNPALTATIRYPNGGRYANIASATVTLPPTELIDNAHLQDPCTRVQFAQGSTPGEKCPPGSVIGSAQAQTPLLEKPLEGPVYLRSAPENKSGLPDLVAALNGQINLTLDGKISTIHRRSIRTTFATIPDAPVSHFTLSLDGGHKGLLENTTNLCDHPLHVSAAIGAQNGRTADQSPALGTPCGSKAKKHRHRLHRAQVWGQR